MAEDPPSGKVDQDEPAAAPERRRGVLAWLKRELLPFAELFALTGFVIAQPLLDVTGRAPDFFLFHQARGADIVWLAVIVAFVPALALWLGEVLVGLVSPTLRRIAHLVLIGGLFAVLAIEISKKVWTLDGIPLALLALVVGALLAVACARFKAVGLWVRFTSFAPLLFVGLFLFASPVAKLVVPEEPGQVGTPAPARNPVPVVMIMFDEFPLQSLLSGKGEIDERVYPNFAKFAQDATWYRNATGASSWTPWAMPAMMTGRWPARGKAPFYAEYPDNMFTMLSQTYDVQAYETISLLCPPSECAGTQQPVDREATGLQPVLRDTAGVLRRIVSPRNVEFDPTEALLEKTAGEAASGKETAAPTQTTKKPGPMFRFNTLKESQPARFTEFLDGLGPSDTPTFDFLHILLPHAPWRYLPGGAQYQVPSGTTFGTKANTPWPADRWPSLFAQQRHLLQLAYTDQLLGQVIQKLKDTGQYDKSLVIFTADHGEGFTPGSPARRFSEANAHQLAWVPVFIKAPGQAEGKVDDRNWEQVDLLPTIADYLDVDIPWQVEGISALAGKRTTKEKVFYDSPGKPIQVEPTENFAKVLKGATDTIGYPERGPTGFYSLKDLPDIVGKRTDQLQVTGGGPTATIARPERFANVDPGSGIVPSIIWGDIGNGEIKSGATVAVAIDGTIGGIGQAYVNQGDETIDYASLINDQVLKPGANHPELFLVEGTKAAPVLRRITVTQG